MAMLRRTTWVLSSTVSTAWRWTALRRRGTVTRWRGGRTDDRYATVPVTQRRTMAPCWPSETSSIITPDSMNVVSWTEKLEMSLDAKRSCSSKLVCAAVSRHKFITCLTACWEMPGRIPAWLCLWRYRPVALSTCAAVLMMMMRDDLICT